MSDSNAASYDQVRDRLDEIVVAVSAPGISLDEALASSMSTATSIS